MKQNETIKEFWENNPTMPSEQAAEILGVSRNQVRVVKSMNGITNKKHSETLGLIIKQQKEEISRLKAIILSLLAE
jgi:hypothetical protein